MARSGSTGRFRFLSGLAVLVAGLTGLAGCDTAGDPGPQPHGPRFDFSPAVDSLVVESTDHVDFQVASSPAVGFNVAWDLDGRQVSVGPNFRFFPPGLGEMHLRARASYLGSASEFIWDITVSNQHPLDFTFEPPGQEVQMVVLETREFRVSLDWPFARTYAWLRGNQVVGTDSTYLYTAQAAGLDSLCLAVSAGERLVTRTWRIDIQPNRPAAPAVVLARDGDLGGSVRIIWEKVEPVVYAIAGYKVAASFEGPLTEDNWGGALQLGTFEPVPGMTWYRRTFTQAEDGMIPGARGWFAVRSVDERGVMSAVSENAVHLLSEDYWVQGLISDDLGHPLAGVTVSVDAVDLSVQTDAGGRYRIGPFPNFLEFVLGTETPNEDQPGQPGTSWHDYHTTLLSLDQDLDLDLCLLTRYGADLLCADNEGSFLRYFRHMTRTDLTTNLRPDRRLYKWDHYPLAVYIPVFTGAGGIDFRENCAVTLDIWNTNTGEDFFVLTDDPEQADVVFLFDDMGGAANGQASIVLPDDQPYQLGDVVPQRMCVYIHDTLDDEQRIRETALHELGHVLGLVRHSSCSRSGYLMYFTAAGALDNGPENAIHPDELRAVRAIRHLPQGYDMEGF